MKRIFSRSLPLFLALALALLPIFSLASCGKKAAVMSCGNVEITEDLYEYWMGTYKAKILNAYTDVKDTAEYWSSMINDTQTAEEYLTEMVDTILKHKLLSVYVFDTSGFRLSDSDREMLNYHMQTLVSDFTENGKKSEFNEYCEQFGIDYDGVKLMLSMEYKTDALGELLFGKNGKQPLTESDRDTYYRAEYCRIKEIWVNTKFKYVTDSEGKRVTDDQGYYKTRDLTEEELAAALALADEIEAKLETVTTDAEFEALIDEYSDFDLNTEYPNGMYLCETSTYINKVVMAGLSLEVGEMTSVESEYGKHFVRGYALEDKAYSDDKNKDFFENFDSGAMSYFLELELAKHEDKVVVDREVKALYTLSKVKRNSYYFY